MFSNGKIACGALNFTIQVQLKQKKNLYYQTFCMANLLFEQIYTLLLLKKHAFAIYNGSTIKIQTIQFSDTNIKQFSFAEM